MTNNWGACGYHIARFSFETDIDRARLAMWLDDQIGEENLYWWRLYPDSDSVVLQAEPDALLIWYRFAGRGLAEIRSYPSTMVVAA